MVIFYLVSSTLLLLSQSSGEKLVHQICNIKRYANIEINSSNVVIGGIFPLHVSGTDGYGCGKYAAGNMQLYEAARWAIKKINSRSLAGTGLNLGMQAWDNCLSDNLAVGSVLGFFSQSTAQGIHCNSSNAVVSLGIVGPFTSWSAVPIAKFLAKFSYSQISYGAASSELSDKSIYPYFIRTVPSSAATAKATVSLLEILQWRYVIAVYSDDKYGSGAFKEFLKASAGVCVTQAVRIAAADSVQTIKDKLAVIVQTAAKGGLIFAPTGRTTAIMEALNSRGDAGKLQWILSDISLNAAYTNTYLRGALFIAPKTTLITEFKTHWINADTTISHPENPWYQEWYMEQNNCRLPGMTSGRFNSRPNCAAQTKANLERNYMQGTYVEPTVKAMFAYSKAIQQAQQVLCFGQLGVCPALLQLKPEDFHNNYLKKVDFTFSGTDGAASLTGTRVKFDSNGDLITNDFILWNFKYRLGADKFLQVGTYKNNVWNVSSANIEFYNTARSAALPGSVMSPCPAGGCPTCLSSSKGAIQFAYIPGDILLGGLFPFHRSGKHLLSCGPLSYEFLSGLAFQYALTKRKTNFSNILNGLTLGGLYMDTCHSTVLIKNFLTGFHSGNTMYHDKFGNIIDPSLVLAYVSQLYSSEAVSTTLLLNSLGYPLVGSSATSVILSDKNRFPRFSRTLPGDDKQVRAIVRLLLQLKWSLVQVVYSSGVYGQTAMELLRKLGAASSVCVTATHEIGSIKDYDSIVTGLKKYGHAKGVVVFAIDVDIQGLLMALKKANASKEFMFIGSEAWGTLTSVVTGVEDVADGSLTLRLISRSSSGFMNFLNSLNPRAANEPWITELYQQLFNCCLNAGSCGVYAQVCGSIQPVTASPRFSQYDFTFTYYIINAVTAVAMALNKTLSQYCGINYTAICSNFRQANISDVLLNNIQTSSFLDETKNKFVMENGEGLTGYEIYNYLKNKGYLKIGNYSISTGSLILNQKLKTVQSMCPSYCHECYYMAQYQQFLYKPGDVILGAVFGIHKSKLDDLFMCGDIQLTHGFQFVSAMQYAIDMVNNGTAPVSLNSLKLGSLILDHCQNPARSFGLVSGLYAGALRINSALKPQMIGTWLTDTTSSATQVAHVSGKLNIPVVSPSATSEILSDRAQFPTFFRTVPGADTQAMAVTKLCKILNFKYVQIVGLDNSFGISGIKMVKTIAEQNGVCIIASHHLNKMTNMSNLIQDILKHPTAVVILYSDEAHTEALLKAKQENSAASGLVFITVDPYERVAKKYGQAASGMLSLKVKSSLLHGYLKYLRSHMPQKYLSSGFFEEYYQAIHQCDLPGYYKYKVVCSKVPLPVTSSGNFYQDNYALPTINAVFAAVYALNKTIEQECGKNNNGFCTKFISSSDSQERFLQNLQDTVISHTNNDLFKFYKREGNSAYQIVRFNGSHFVDVGTFSGSLLRISDALRSKYQSVQSSCIRPCFDCIRNTLNFTYIHGDVYVAGLFDVHKQDLNPFTCGRIKTLHGFQLLEAFHYAINQVNAKKGMFSKILRGVRLGGIGLDGCESAIRTGYLVSNINNKLTILEKRGTKIDSKDIYVYLGAQTSDRSIYLARILNSLHIPQISYAATSTQLDDRDKYPFFLRTVPSDFKLAEAVVTFLDKFNIRYVQVVHSPSNYGVLGGKAFNSESAGKKICVAQTVVFPDNGTVTQESANDVVSLILKKPFANTIVVFAEIAYINELLKAIQRDTNAVGKFVFIGTEVWGTNMEPISGVQTIAVGSVTMTIESIDLRNFDSYLSTKTPNNYPENPWFPEYYEEILQCYLTQPDLYRTRCSVNPQNLVAAKHYLQDPGILHTVNAVYAAAFGLHATLEWFCGKNYSAVCEAFKTASDRREVLLENLKKVNFSDATGKSFLFNKHGDGNKGYFFHQLTKGVMNSYIYEKIGTSTNDAKLDIRSSFKPRWTGTCERIGACSECPIVQNRLTRYMVRPAGKQAEKIATIVGMFDVHLKGEEYFRCGRLNFAEDFQNVLAFFYGIKLANSLQKFQYRGLALDTCSNSIRVDQAAYSLLTKGTLCNSKYSYGNNIDNSTIVAFLTMNTENSIAANRVLSPMKISFVSPSASNVAMSDHTKFPYYFHTIASYDYPVDLIVKILKQNAWSYVSVVYSNNFYGQLALAELKKKASEQGICIAFESATAYSNMNATVATVVQLDKQKGANVVVLLTQPEDGQGILMAAKTLGLNGRFVWIGTNTWENHKLFASNLKDIALGAITVGMRSVLLSGFRDYVKSHTYTNRMDVPNDWFEEFYQHVHGCRLDDAKKPLNFPNQCSKSETITDDMFMQNRYVLNTVVATYTIATAFNQFWTKCPALDITPCMNTTVNVREKIMNELEKVQWNVSSKLQINSSSLLSFKFTNHSWNSGYEIYNYIKSENAHEYKKLGSWAGGDLKMNIPTFYNKYGETHRPISQCPVLSTCTCANTLAAAASKQTVVANSMANLVSIYDRPRNYYFYKNGDKVYDWPLWAIIVAILSGVGIFITLIIFIYLFFAYPKNGGTTILGFFFIFGILGIYGVNFAFFMYAELIRCAARRFVMGVVYAICFSSMLVKAIDNWRFGDHEFEKRRYKQLASGPALILMSLGIVCMQVIIPVQWLILVSPTATNKLPNALHDHSWCDPPELYDEGLVLSFIFIILLVLITGIFGAIAWDSEKNYYESRWITVASICTAGCFLVWMVVSTIADPHYRDPAVAIGNLVNATALLICLPLRKARLLVTMKQREKKMKKYPYNSESSAFDGNQITYDNYVENLDDPTMKRASNMEY